ncbi:MAG: phospholipid carrier-dependent glycosyltransferase [Planctomycetes bacterium]|nr:phospholipid carrier-dependent glycosyltransferase [Planctomycetota bacterium]
MIPSSHADAPPRWAQCSVLAVAIALVWHSLGNHALFPPDEGRYAAVSGWMATHGNWFEPTIRDELHITKPPLAYWAQAASMRAFGMDEFAARLPSAVSSTLLLLSAFAFARRCLGSLVATLSVAVLACMPLFEVVGRLAITDAMLALWWWLATCAAWMAFCAGRARAWWVLAFWASSALVGATKGPLLLAPFAVVVCWLALAGRLRELRMLRPWIGLPLAVVPLALVAWGFYVANPDRTLDVWRFEFVDRFTGGKHDTPRWSIPAAFVAGLFPATAMLTLPWFNMPWRRALDAFRTGDLRALLLVAVVLPLIGFTVLRGSSPTYLLPLAPPLAVLVGIMLARWIDGSVADMPAGYTPPDVRITIGAVLTLLALAMPLAAVIIVGRGDGPAWAPGWSLAWWSLAFVPAAAASWLCMALWKRRDRRLPTLGLVCLAWLGGWAYAHRVEDQAMERLSMRPLVASLPPGCPVAVVGFTDLGIDWLLGRWTAGHWGGKPLRAWMDAHPDGRVLVEQAELDRMRAKKDPNLRRLDPVDAFDAWPMRRINVCRVIAP